MPSLVRRRAGWQLGVAALVFVTAAAAIGATWIRPDRTGQNATASVDPTTTTTAPVVVERRLLDPGTSQYATVLSAYDRIVVRDQPPPGWDLTLTPVVTTRNPAPPRSGADLTRVPLPSQDEPITGRRVSARGWIFDNPSPFEPPQPLVLAVTERQGDWLEVRIPVRPNGTVGWIEARAVRLSTTTRSVEVRLTERRLRVIDAGRVLLDVPAGIGKPATPTPTGEFMVTDRVPSADPGGGYGPVALALDGYSEVMDSFGGEEGTGAPANNVPVLAIHGTNRPASVGAAQSNGCPRLLNEDVLRLAELVTPGTPVRIWP